MNRIFKQAFMSLAVVFAHTGTQAALVTYSVNITLSQGVIGANATHLFESSVLDTSVFGAATGSMTYDGDDYQFISDIFGVLAGETTPIVVGHQYSVAGSISLTLANGTAITQSGVFGVDVITDASFAPFGPSFSVHSRLVIPVGLWVGDTPPQPCLSSNFGDCWAEWASSLTIQSTGLTGGGELPPSELSNVGIRGYLCADLDRDGVVMINTNGSAQIDCGELITSTASINAVPIPGAIYLFGSGIIGLIGLKKIQLKLKGSEPFKRHH